MSSGIPTEPTRDATRTDCRTVCLGSIRPGVEEISLGGHPDPEGQEITDTDRGLHQFF